MIAEDRLGEEVGVGEGFEEVVDLVVVEDDSFPVPTWVLGDVVNRNLPGLD